MTAHAVYRAAKRRRTGSIAVLPFALLMAIILSGAAFVSYVLWPTWSGATLGIDAPTIPVTVAGVLFELPPAAVRAAVQRHPGPHERIDLAFLWPSLLPP
ncbi:MAG: hypothetical protein WB562_01485, partial [Candidatus Sulfotelmatobacter sp.]